jgi:hypothetical protein
MSGFELIIKPPPVPDITLIQVTKLDASVDLFKLVLIDALPCVCILLKILSDIFEKNGYDITFIY